MSTVYPNESSPRDHYLQLFLLHLAARLDLLQQDLLFRNKLKCVKNTEKSSSGTNNVPIERLRRILFGEEMLHRACKSEKSETSYLSYSSDLSDDDRMTGENAYELYWRSPRPPLRLAGYRDGESQPIFFDLTVRITAESLNGRENLSGIVSGYLGILDCTNGAGGSYRRMKMDNESCPSHLAALGLCPSTPAGSFAHLFFAALRDVDGGLSVTEDGCGLCIDHSSHSSPLGKARINGPTSVEQVGQSVLNMILGNIQGEGISSRRIRGDILGEVSLQDEDGIGRNGGETSLCDPIGERVKLFEKFLALASLTKPRRGVKRFSDCIPCERISTKLSKQSESVLEYSKQDKGVYKHTDINFAPDDMKKSPHETILKIKSEGTLIDIPQTSEEPKGRGLISVVQAPSVQATCRRRNRRGGVRHIRIGRTESPN
mmetsp:Transcript_47424/g.92543  ORF Transcript_47424/g.92543 Transcript_47424/m.92543 type:complete len:431 (+) Transcript_47424:50-1342(+)